MRKISVTDSEISEVQNVTRYTHYGTCIFGHSHAMSRFKFNFWFAYIKERPATKHSFWLLSWKSFQKASNSEWNFCSSNDQKKLRKAKTNAYVTKKNGVLVFSDTPQKTVAATFTFTLLGVSGWLGCRLTKIYSHNRPICNCMKNFLTAERFGNCRKIFVWGYNSGTAKNSETLLYRQKAFFYLVTKNQDEVASPQRYGCLLFKKFENGSRAKTAKT